MPQHLHLEKDDVPHLETFVPPTNAVGTLVAEAETEPCCSMNIDQGVPFRQEVHQPSGVYQIYEGGLRSNFLLSAACST